MAFKWVFAPSTVTSNNKINIPPSLNNKNYSLKTFKIHWMAIVLWRYINELIIVSKQVFHHTVRSQEEFQNRFFKAQNMLWSQFQTSVFRTKKCCIAINELTIRLSHSQNRFLFWAATESKHCYIFVYEWVDYPPRKCLYKCKSTIITFNSEGINWRHGAQNSCVVSCCLVYSHWYALQPLSKFITTIIMTIWW